MPSKLSIDGPLQSENRLKSAVINWGSRRGSPTRLKLVWGKSAVSAKKKQPEKDCSFKPNRTSKPVVKKETR